MTWGLVVFLCVSLLGGYELFLKQKGFVASIEQNSDLWSWYRAKINNKHGLVIIGASRSQLDIDIPYLKGRFKQYEVTQLSINGHYPMATFRALAEDEEFNATLIVSLNAQALEQQYFDMQSPHNEYFNSKSTTYKSFDAYLSAFFKSKFRVLHPLLGLQQLVEFYEANHSFKSVFYTTNNLDQSVSANYSLTDVGKLYKYFVSDKEENYKGATPTAPESWQKNIDLLVEYSTAIENRGGKVIIVRFPTYKGHWQLDEKYYPRHLYWDKIAENPQLKAIHFNDVNGLEQFESPDSSHLDQKDTAEFTKILFDYLLEKQYL